MFLFFRSIGWQIFRSFFIVITIFIIFMSVFVLQVIDDLIQKNVGNEMKALGSSLAEQVKVYLNNQKSYLFQINYNDSFIREIKKADHTSLNFFLNQSFQEKDFSKYFLDIAIFNNNGENIATTSKNWESKHILNDSYFRLGKIDFHFGSTESDPEAGPLQLIAIPLRDGAETVGVVIGRFKLHHIFDILNQNIGFNEHTRAFLINKQLSFIFPEKSSYYQSYLLNTPIVNAIHDPYWTGEYDNIKGQRVFATFSKIEGYPWYLLIERDIEYVKQEYIEIKKIFSLIILVSMLIVIITTFYIVKSLTRPLSLLAADARRIASNDLRSPVTISKSSLEVSQVASEMERMRQRLFEYQEQLLDKLEESEQRRAESERLAAIGTLAASMAHEIRNPLNSMSLMLSRLERKRKDKDQSEINVFLNLRSEITRLDALISEILDYSKPLVLSYSFVDIHQFVYSIISFFEDDFYQHSIQCKIKEHFYNLHAYIDDQRIKQCFVNIIKNAMDAMPQGGELLIEWTCLLQEKLIRFWIQDSGIGIPLENKKRIFDLFFTTKEKGTGFGLSIVQKIVDIHGGWIAFDREDFPGTCICITLPFHTVLPSA